GQARPFPQFDEQRLGKRQLAEGPHIRSERVREHLSIAAIVLGAGRGEAIAKAIELLGVDGIDLETAFKQCFNHRPVRHLDSDMHTPRLAIRYTAEPSGHVRTAIPAMSKHTLAKTHT